MIDKKIVILFALLSSLVTFACVYIVLPEGLETPVVEENAHLKVWTGIATNATEVSNDLHIDITIRNDTGDWGTMEAIPEKPAILNSGDGKTTNCDTVFVSTGGHRMAPGFQMRGYTFGDAAKPETQLLYVECKGVKASAGSKLLINYQNFAGILDDYDPGANKTEGTMEISLDKVDSGLKYPIAVEVDGLVLKPETSITGLSENVVTLLETQRIDTGLQFKWQNFNPTKFPLKTHIGTPPVIGDDGIIYGVFETIDMVSVPITPAKSNVDWTTEVAVPKDVKGLYILLSVESNKPRTYINYVLDISDK